jgi:hypothetical protein
LTYIKQIQSLAFEAFGAEAVEQVDSVERLFFVRLEDRLIVLMATSEVEGVRIEVDVKPGMWVGDKEEDDWDFIGGYEFRDWLESASQPDGPGNFVCVDDELKITQWLPLDGLSAASLRLTTDALLIEMKRAYYELIREHS